MTKRNILLIGVLAFSYLAMVAYLTYRYPEQGSVLSQLTFGIVLVGAAVIGLLLKRGKKRGRGVLRALKVLAASYAIAFAVWMLCSVILHPLIGYEGFLLVGQPILFYVLAGVALLVSPLIAKRLA